MKCVSWVRKPLSTLSMHFIWPKIKVCEISTQNLNYVFTVGVYKLYSENNKRHCNNIVEGIWYRSINKSIAFTFLSPFFYYYYYKCSVHWTLNLVAELYCRIAFWNRHCAGQGCRAPCQDVGRGPYVGNWARESCGCRQEVRVGDGAQSVLRTVCRCCQTYRLNLQTSTTIWQTRRWDRACWIIQSIVNSPPPEFGDGLQFDRCRNSPRVRIGGSCRLERKSSLWWC